MQDSIPQKNDSAPEVRVVFPILPGRESAPPFADPPNQLEELKPAGIEFVNFGSLNRTLEVAKVPESNSDSGDPPTSNKPELKTTYNGAEAMNSQSTYVASVSKKLDSSSDSMLNQDFDPFADDTPANTPPAENPAAENPPADKLPADSLPGEVEPKKEVDPTLKPTQDPAFDPFSESDDKNSSGDSGESKDVEPAPLSDPPKVEMAPPKLEPSIVQDPLNVESSNAAETVLPGVTKPLTNPSIGVAPKTAAPKQSLLAEWEPLLRVLIPILLLLLVAALAWFLFRGRRRKRSRKSSSGSSSDETMVNPQGGKGFVKRNKGGTLDSGLVDETPQSGLQSSELENFLEPYDAQPAKRQLEDDDSDFQFLEDDDVSPATASVGRTEPKVQEQDEDDFDFTDFDDNEPVSAETTMEVPSVAAPSAAAEDEPIEFDDSFDFVDTVEMEADRELETASQNKVESDFVSQLVDRRMEDRDGLTIDGQAREIVDLPSLMGSSESEQKKGFFSRLMGKSQSGSAFEDSTPTIPSTDLDQFEIAEENLGDLFDGYKPTQIQADSENFGDVAPLSTPSVPGNGSASEFERSIARLQDENTKLVLRLRTAEAELDSFSEQQIQQIKELNLEQKNHLADLEMKRSELDAARSECQRLDEENYGLRSELGRLRDQMGEFSANDASEQRLESLESELKESKASMASIVSELDSVRLENSRLISALEEQKNQLESSSNLSSRSEALESQLNESIAGKAAVEAELNSIRLENSRMASALEEQKIALESTADLSARVEDLQRRLEQANHECSASVDHANRSSEENQDLRNKLAELELQLQQAAGSKVPMDSASLDREVKLKFTKLYNSFEKERKLRKETSEQLDQAEEQIATMRKMIKSLQSQSS